VSKNRVKIDINCNDGNKISVSLEGSLTRDKVLQVLDFIDLLGESPKGNEHPENSNLSKYERIQNIILRKFPIGWFSSQEVMIAYEDALDEPIGLSTVSTYLTRLATKGILTRSGSVVKRRYKITNFVSQSNKSRYNIPP
jgi:hypothetical protein